MACVLLPQTDSPSSLSLHSFIAAAAAAVVVIYRNQTVAENERASNENQFGWEKNTRIHTQNEENENNK